MDHFWYVWIYMKKPYGDLISLPNLFIIKSYLHMNFFRIFSNHFLAKITSGAKLFSASFLDKFFRQKRKIFWTIWNNFFFLESDRALVELHFLCLHFVIPIYTSWDIWSFLISSRVVLNFFPALYKNKGNNTINVFSS